jgi:hypothetical protein
MLAHDLEKSQVLKVNFMWRSSVHRRRYNGLMVVPPVVYVAAPGERGESRDAFYPYWEVVVLY